MALIAEIFFGVLAAGIALMFIKAMADEPKEIDPKIKYGQS
jgi:hypothetical protein